MKKFLMFLVLSISLLGQAQSDFVGTNEHLYLWDAQDKDYTLIQVNPESSILISFKQTYEFVEVMQNGALLHYLIMENYEEVSDEVIMLNYLDASARRITIILDFKVETIKILSNNGDILTVYDLTRIIENNN